MYWMYRSTKGTNAPYILTGVVALYFLWVVVKGFNMELLSTILGQIMAVGVLALIIIFQPEIRRFLQLIRLQKRHLRFIEQIFRTKSNVTKSTNVKYVAESIIAMSQNHIGGIVVLAQHSDLSLITEGGRDIDAKLSSDLLLTILSHDSKLRKGAVVVDSGRIVSAGCILPITQSETPDSYGIRHKVALGLSEISDAVVVVVDSRDGTISIVNSGIVKDKISTSEVTKVLQEYENIYNEDTVE